MCLIYSKMAKKNQNKTKEQENVSKTYEGEILPNSFSQEEIRNIHYYITTQIPHTILPRMFILTENLSEKCSIFITIFSTIESCRFYIKNDDTRDKLKKLLDEGREVFNQLYDLYLEKVNSELNMGNTQINDNIAEIVKENNQIINKIRSIFLVFAEKVELTELDKVTGVDTSTETGRNIQSKLAETMQ